jgi:hypothetical protein
MRGLLLAEEKSLIATLWNLYDHVKQQHTDGYAVGNSLAQRDQGNCADPNEFVTISHIRKDIGDEQMRYLPATVLGLKDAMSTNAYLIGKSEGYAASVFETAVRLTSPVDVVEKMTKFMNEVKNNHIEQGHVFDYLLVIGVDFRKAHQTGFSQTGAVIHPLGMVVQEKPENDVQSLLNEDCNTSQIGSGKPLQLKSESLSAGADGVRPSAMRLSEKSFPGQPEGISNDQPNESCVSDYGPCPEDRIDLSTNEGSHRSCGVKQPQASAQSAGTVVECPLLRERNSSPGFVNWEKNSTTTSDEEEFAQTISLDEILNKGEKPIVRIPGEREVDEETLIGKENDEKTGGRKVPSAMVSTTVDIHYWSSPIRITNCRNLSKEILRRAADKRYGPKTSARTKEVTSGSFIDHKEYHRQQLERGDFTWVKDPRRYKVGPPSRWRH